jgi:hypothetical protein
VAHENPQVHNLHHSTNAALVKGATREKFKEKGPWDNSVLSISDDDSKVHAINKRHSDNSIDNVNNKDLYLKKLFVKYGDGKTLTMDGFQNLLDHLFEIQSGQANHADESDGGHTNDTVRPDEMLFVY